MKNFLKLLLWVVIIQSLGLGAGMITQSSVDSWYLTLHKSSLTPANIAFPIVWSSLYILIALSGWLIWQNRIHSLTKIKSVFVMQLILNFSWTPTFFYFHLIGAGLAIIGAILVCLAYIIMRCFKEDKTISWLLMPYLLWSSLAFYLNLYIWIHN